MSRRPAELGNRYTPTQQALHWITAALMFTAIPLAWVMVNMPTSAQSRGQLFTVHKSLGLTIVAITVARLAWRHVHPAPPFPQSFARWDRIIALLSHWMLYLILVGMPVSGYLMDAAGGYPISYFGLFTVPGLSKIPALSEGAHWVHVAVGQWLVYVLIVLHVAATVWHVAVRRDGTLDRMLPAQGRADEPPRPEPVRAASSGQR